MIKRFRRWKKWQARSFNSRIFKILVLLGVIKAETFECFCVIEDLREMQKGEHDETQSNK